MSTRHGWCWLALLLTASGCVINSEKYPRPRDLSPSWLIDRPRLLAVVAEPPEARPGETVQFRALLVDPDDELQTTVWVACPEIGSNGVGVGCDPDTADIIGVEPLFSPTYAVPLNLLDPLPPADRIEGGYVLVQVLGLPPNEGELDFSTIDFAAVESGYKRVVVSEAITPNANPAFESAQLDGLEVPLGAALVVDPEAPYEVSVRLDEDTIETYTFINRAGNTEQRVEQPYVSWYTTDGTLLESTTLHPFLRVTWLSPTAGREGSIYAVVRDRRGGMEWLELRFRVR